MESIVATVIIITLLIVSVLGLTQVAMSTQATLSDSSRLMQERVSERTRTGVSSVAAVTSGDFVTVTLKNTGSTKLADYDKWDVILQYSDVSSSQVKWYPYGTGVNQWKVAGIYQTTSPAVAELADPGILNPGEEMVVTVNVSPNVKTGSTNLAVIGTPNGITASAVFTR
jgi:archaellum component FlaF (FlaF/FlaG flagellin family)